MKGIFAYRPCAGVTGRLVGYAPWCLPHSSNKNKFFTTKSPVCLWVMIIFKWNWIRGLLVFKNLLNTHSLPFSHWFGVAIIKASICSERLLPWSHGSGCCIYSSSFGFGALPSQIELTIYGKTNTHTHTYMYTVHALHTPQIQLVHTHTHIHTHTHTHTHPHTQWS